MRLPGRYGRSGAQCRGRRGRRQRDPQTVRPLQRGRTAGGLGGHDVGGAPLPRQAAERRLGQRLDPPLAGGKRRRRRPQAMRPHELGAAPGGQALNLVHRRVGRGRGQRLATAPDAASRSGGFIERRSSSPQVPCKAADSSTRKRQTRREAGTQSQGSRRRDSPVAKDGGHGSPVVARPCGRPRQPDAMTPTPTPRTRPLVASALALLVLGVLLYAGAAPSGPPRRELDQPGQHVRGRRRTSTPSRSRWPTPARSSKAR